MNEGWRKRLERMSKSGTSKKKRRKRVSVDSNSLLSVEHKIEQFTASGKSTWKRGLLIECQKELGELREELPNFNPAEWRIVRVETHLVTDNAKMNREGE